MTDEEREERIISELVKLCAPEIFGALAADLVGRVFCNLYILVDYKHKKACWVGGARVVRAGVGRAIGSCLNNSGTDIATLVRTSVAEELAERRDEKIKELRGQRAREILPSLLEITRRNSCDAAVLLDHLTVHQRSDLKVLLHDELSEKPVIYIRMDREPEEARMWLFWYLYHSEIAQPENKQAMGGIPMYCFAIRRGAVRTNKAKDIVFPLGPMYAQIYKKLGREINKHGHQIKDPESVNRIAKSLNVSHATASAWLKEDVPVKIRPDGRGGVYWDFTNVTVERCVEIVTGKKRGPKTNDFYKPSKKDRHLPRRRP